MSVQHDNLTREEARTRARTVADVRYELRFDLTGDDERFGCEAVVRFRGLRPGEPTFLDYVAERVVRATLNGAPLPDDAHDGSRLHLPAIAEENELRIEAVGSYERSGVGLHRFRDPVDDRAYVHSDFEPFDAHHAYPCFDQPDLKAVIEFSALVPSGWVVLSNSAPAGAPEESAAGALWRFAPTRPIPPYISALVAGPYHHVHARHGDIDLGLYCRESLASHLDADADEIFEITRQGFDFYQRAFDYPYPFGKYDQVFVPEFIPGAMENPGCVTFNEAYVFRSKVTEASRERRAGTILHEMAHMWFGDLVTMRWWDDLWLNESFAEFMATLSLVRATRFAGGWVTFADGVKTWAYQQDQLPSTHPIVNDMPDTLSIRVNFDGITYAKGASVLRQLVAWVGEEAFFRGLRRYFRRHEYGNTELADFLAALEEASGRDLKAWSREWLETAGVNTLRSVVATDGGGERPAYADVRIRQEAPADHAVLRSHRIGIGLYDVGAEGLVRRGRVELDVEGPETPAPLSGEPVADLLLLNDEDLGYAKVRLGAHSLATMREHLGELRDPLARALCWTALWDMVRDAELSTREYVEIVLRHAPVEDDIGVLQRLLGQAQAAIDAYGAPDNRAAVRSSLAAAARAQALAAGPGSQDQLVWVRAFASAAGAAEDLDLVRGLLDGRSPFDQLAVDTDLRWHLVVALAAAGRADGALIDAELERDPTIAGRNYAATARAARPAAEAKAEAWDGVVHLPAPPVATMQAIIRGFQHAGQEELLLPYRARYFSSIGEMWNGRDRQTGLAFVRGMFPARLIDEETVAATDRFLSSDGVDAPVRRTLVEGKDGVLRALRARAHDAASAARPSPAPRS